MVCGSRDYHDQQYIEEEMLKYVESIPKQEVMFITGGARGVDAIADEVAKRHGFNRCILPAHWECYPGKSAGMIRNKLMLSVCTDVLAFHKNNSKGTKHMIDIAVAANKRVKIIDVN